MSFTQAQVFGGHFSTAPSPGYQHLPAIPTPTIPPGVLVTHEGLPRVLPTTPGGFPPITPTPVMVGGYLPFLQLFLRLCRWLLLR